MKLFNDSDVIKYTPWKQYKLDVKTLLEAEAIIKREETDNEVLLAREALNSILAGLNLKAKNLDLEINYAFKIMEFQKGRKKDYEFRLYRKNQEKLDYLFKFIKHDDITNAQAEEKLLNALLYLFVKEDFDGSKKTK
ncbi:MAG: hypothetical protein ACYCS1_04345 [Gammaproteobacteria bacterium]